MPNETTESKEWSANLPYGAELHAAPKKRFQETILVVPFYGGLKAQMRKHVDFLVELGFDVVDFEFQTSFKTLPDRLISAQHGLGYKHVWADLIENLLNQIPGKKIIFAFSNPSSGAIEAVARRHATDVVAMIADGGPTARYFSSLVKYFTTETPLPLAPARWAAASLLTPLWSLNARATLHEDLSRFPEGFPILSIRGWKDHLIPPKHIDEVFEPHSQLDWQKLSLPEGGHLNGLKDFPAEYIPVVQSFLKGVATSVSASTKK